jgi:hypothetical protein
MIYLHESQSMIHGRLQSSNCLVDSRWVLQIGGFGMDDVRAGETITQEIEQKRKKSLLWKAPEILRQLPLPTITPASTTSDHSSTVVSGGGKKVKSSGGNKTPQLLLQRKADVYSFAIVLHEILARQGPWGSMLSAADRESFFLQSPCYPHSNRSLPANRPMLHETGVQWLCNASDESGHPTRHPARSLTKHPRSDLTGSVFAERCKRARSHSTFDPRRSAGPRISLPAPAYDEPFSVVVEGTGSLQGESALATGPTLNETLDLGSGQTDAKRTNSARRPHKFGALNELRFDWKDGEKSSARPVPGATDVTELTIDQIVDRLCHPSKFGNTIFRPEVKSFSNWPAFLVDCMCLCWDEQPEMRPDFRRINTMLKDMLASSL